MEDRQLNRNAHAFLGNGARILAIGAAVAVLGGLIWLLGTTTDDVVQAVGGMIAWLGIVVASVGVALLVIAAVTHRMARRRPFA